jgi:hypothetical protein
MRAYFPLQVDGQKLDALRQLPQRRCQQFFAVRAHAFQRALDPG